MSPLPTRISRYEIKGLIAQGGMGDLYLAQDPDIGRLVVFKLLNSTLDSSELRDRFEREARALASLNHASIVDIYDSGDFQGAPYIVMEYIRGETLAEAIQRQAPISLAEKLRLMIELCAGLAQAHRAGIIHRDVKPANLMVDQDGRLKILDFGIARVADSDLTRIGSLTTHGVMQIGTPGYMSPEQTQGRDIDCRADIFAVGAVCYELLSYRGAFSGANLREIEIKVLKDQPAPLASLVPGLDPEIDVILARALAKDRDQRYQDMASLGQALEHYRARLGPSGDGRSVSLVWGGEDRPGRSPADVAYERALAASHAGLRGAVRRFAIEALAEDPDHAGARALLGPLAPPRPSAPAPPLVPSPPPAPAPTQVSIPVPVRPVAPAITPSAQRPPTVLSAPPDATLVNVRVPRPSPPPDADQTIVMRKDRPAAVPPPPSAPAPASSPRFASAAPPVDATIVIQRPRPPIPARADETVLISRENRSPRTPSADRSSHVSSVDPTILLNRTQPPPVQTPPSGKTVRANRSRPVGAPLRERYQHLQAALSLVWTRWRAQPQGRQASGRGAAPRGTRGVPLWNGSGRGALIVVGVTLLAAGTVFAGVRFISWMSSGQLLTITRPAGGTISSKGIKCGTAASDCSTRLGADEYVQLEATPDKGFDFDGFTGDCAPTGRVLMTAPHTCGANFKAGESSAASIGSDGWVLTVIPPKGGTLVTPGGIRCGPTDSSCSASFRNGEEVTLSAVPEPGFALQAFTDACEGTGRVRMDGARTCSATFTQVVATAQSPQPSTPTRGRPPTVPSVTVGPATAGGSNTVPSVPVAPAQVTNPVGPTVKIDGNPAAPPAPAETPEEHAKKEIQLLLKDYCAALETLDPVKLRGVYPSINLRDYQTLFKQYKSDKCMLVGTPEFVQLDANAGTARIEVGVKQVIEMITGGAPKTVETIAAMSLLREETRTAWRITQLKHTEKPKP